jgi:adenylate kinase family enzyme
MEIKNCKKFLILGDSGRGKSTLAQLLSKNLNIKNIELDDIFWVKKYSVRRTDEEQIELLQNILSKEDNWIIEGSTRHLVKECLKSADCILFLTFKNILSQWYHVFRRSYKRKDSLKETINLCIHLFKKRYGLGNSKGKQSLRERIEPYSEKTRKLNSWKEINSFVDNLK